MMTLAAILLTCATLSAVDGDTIKCDGVNMRDMGDGKPFVSGYDAPETSEPKCQEELELGRAAKAMMSELLPGAEVYDSGKRDRYKRPLVWVRLKDGRAIGSLLIAEGLARKWSPKYLADWCHPLNPRRRVSLAALKTTLRALQEAGINPVALDQLADGTLRWHFARPQTDTDAELDRELAAFEAKHNRR